MLPPVEYGEMVAAVGVDQPSVLHLGNYIHAQAMPLFEERVAALREAADQGDYDTRAAIAMQVESLDALDVDTLVARYLSPEENRDIPDPDLPREEGMPALLSMTPTELTTMLRKVAHSSHLTLILADLELEDVLEILFRCQGRITHLEVFNTKHLDPGQTRLRMPFSQLQQALNEQNAVKLKRLIRGCMNAVRERGGPDDLDRLEVLEGCWSGSTGCWNSTGGCRWARASARAPRAVPPGPTAWASRSWRPCPCGPSARPRGCVRETASRCSARPSGPMNTSCPGSRRGYGAVWSTWSPRSPACAGWSAACAPGGVWRNMS